jgi:hypothetical protein
VAHQQLVQRHRQKRRPAVLRDVPIRRVALKELTDFLTFLWQLSHFAVI